MKKIQVCIILALLSLFFTGCSDETISDIGEAEMFETTKAVSKDAVEISLSWDGREDLDLHVIEPDGTHLFFGDVNSSSGTNLNYKDPICDDLDQTHTETISYPTNTALKGKYQVYVDLYGTCGGSTPDWTLTIKANGELTHHSNNIDMVTGPNLLYPNEKSITFTNQ